MDNISIAKTLKVLCAYKDTNITQVGAQLGLSKENIHAQIKRDNFKLNDIIKIADTIGYDTRLQFIDKESGKEIDA